MNYLTTRRGLTASAAQAVLNGLGADGGLYVPSTFPQLSLSDIQAMSAMSYNERAEMVLSPYFPEFPRQSLRQMIDRAYARFREPGVAPLHRLDGNTYVMELYHGPTLAFKDVALTLLPHLMTASAKLAGEGREILILAATSGDTGKAALSGFQDVPGTRCAVFYPRDGVSDAQRLQMVTQRGENTHVIAVKGNFDQAQTGVKRIFSDAQAAAQFDAMGMTLSSANSINWGRLAPQIVYYFSAYCDLLAAGRIRLGDEIDLCVPTGNFGNILAAYYGLRMGLPVHRLICASNRNHVLTDFMNIGVYDTRRDFHVTASPSMDILISSNLERLLFELCGRDGDVVQGWMDSLRDKGAYQVGSGIKAALNAHFAGAWASDEDCLTQIRSVWLEHNYLIDPHTAVAMKALGDYRADTGSAVPCVVASTASPFKFGRAVSEALGLSCAGDDFQLCQALADYTGLEVPPAIAELPTLPVRHTAACEPQDMLSALVKQVTH